MYKICHQFESLKDCHLTFKSLKSALFYLDEHFDEMYQIVKISKEGKILDIYEVSLSAYCLIARSSVGNKKSYRYYKFSNYGVE